MFERLYRLLLKLYPAAFRREYEQEIVQLYRDRLADEGRGLARLRLWFELLWDLAVSLPREYGRRPQSEPISGAYRLSEEAVQRMTAAGRDAGLAALLSTAIGLGLGFLGDAPRWGLVLLCAASLLGASASFRMQRNLRRRWRGYALSVDSERVHMSIWGGSAVTMGRGEITRVAETHGGHGYPGGLVIQGAGDRAIWAPSLLTGYDELRSLLASWTAIEPLPPRNIRYPRLLKLGHSFSLLGIWLFAVTLMVRSPWVFFPLAALIGAPLSYATARVLRTNIPVPAKVIPAVLLALLLAKLALSLR